MLALRTDKAFDSVKVWLTSMSFGGFAVREVSGDNEHWHWLLERPNNDKKKLQALRVGLTRAVPELKGNAGYSLTEVRDVDKYERYMCKGNSESEMPDVAWRESIKYSESRIQELHDSYWSTNRELATARKRQLPPVDEVTQKCKEARIDWKDRTAIAREYIKVYVARKKAINIFQVKSTVNVIQCLLCPDDKAIEVLAEQV